MTQPSPIPSNERIVDAMIELARAATSNRIIVAGINSAEIFLELHRRGYPRVTTTKICLVPCGQHEVALVAWRESVDQSSRNDARPARALLDRLWRLGLLDRLHTNAWPINCSASALRRLGFRIELGTQCQNGIAIAARRVDLVPAAKAA